MPKLILLGGPPGAGKSAALDQLLLISDSIAVLDADDLWRVSGNAPQQAHRQLLFRNVSTTLDGYSSIDLDAVVLAWVFGKPENFAALIDDQRKRFTQVVEIYLTASAETLRERLEYRGDLELLDFAAESSARIDSIDAAKIDTTLLTPREVSEAILREAACDP